MGRRSAGRGRETPRIRTALPPGHGRTGRTYAARAKELRTVHSQVSLALADARDARVSLARTRSRWSSTGIDDDLQSAALLRMVGRIDRLIEFTDGRLQLADVSMRELVRACRRRDAVCRSPLIVGDYRARIDAKYAVISCDTFARSRMEQARDTVDEIHQVTARARVLAEETDARIRSWYGDRVTVPRIATVIRALLPQEKAHDWWCEIASILAECDRDERRRHARSLVRSAARIVGTAWVLKTRKAVRRQRDQD